VAARLEAVIAQSDTGAREAGVPVSEEPNVSDRFHTDLSGNPVLGLFLRILTELWTRHRVNSPTAPQPDPALAAEAANVHRRILQAILAGDEGVARHRMRRHLQALTAWYH
jgi:DNA-binding FadR family transcriptional regulator